MQKKRGDHQKKIFINDSVEALIPFKEEHRSLLKLQVPVEWEWGRLSEGERMGLPIYKRGVCGVGFCWWTVIIR